VTAGLARLAGTLRDPRLQITFGPADHHPRTGESLSSWVRSLPAARRVCVTRSADDEIDAFTWQLQCLSAADLLADAGFAVPPAAADLIRPLAGLHPTVPGWARVLPRLTDVLVTGGLLPDTALYDPGSRSWELPMADLAGVAGVTLTAALQRVIAPPAPHPEGPSGQATMFPATVVSTAAAAAAQLLAGTDGTVRPDLVAELERATGGIPEWFGLDLDPYQRVGALCMAAGHRLCGDAPGLGKTRQILAAAAIVEHRRIIILTPPTVVTHWSRETVAAGLADHPGGEGGQVLALRAGRKIPPLPERGVLIVPDTLIASRPELLAELIDWQPNIVALDEAHRIKTWESKRGKACQSGDHPADRRVRHPDVRQH